MGKKKRSEKRSTGAKRQIARTRAARRPLRPYVIFVLATIILVGLVLRGLYLRELVNTPDFEYPLVDADYHDYWARGVAFGQWSPPRFEPDPKLQEYPYFRPPGYPFFLAAVYRLAGKGYVGPRVVQMLVGLINVLLCFLIARRLFGDVAGLISAALMSTYWVFIYFEGEFLEPSFAVMLVLLIVRVAISWLESQSTLRMLVAGVLLGVLALVRPNALLWVIAVGAWASWSLLGRSQKKRVATTLAVLLAGTLLAVAPVTIRNSVGGRDLVPISSTGGVNLFIGNNDRADGLVRGTMPGIGNLDTSFDWPTIVRNLEAKTGRRMKHSEASDYLASQALQWMRRNPGRVADLMWTKTLLFWGPEEQADNKVVALDRQSSAVLRRIPLDFAVVLGFALSGVLLFFLGRNRLIDKPVITADSSRARREAVVLIVCLIVIWYASHLPFAITARYRVPIIPLLMIFAAFFAEREWGFLKSRRWKKAAVWATALAAALVFTSTDFADTEEPSTARWHYQRGIAYTRSGQAGAAIAEYQRALEANPDYLAVHNDLAAVLASTGRVAESVPHFRKALEGRPNDPSMHFNLALALELTGHPEESLHHYEEALRLRPGDREAAAGMERVRRMMQGTRK